MIPDFQSLHRPILDVAQHSEIRMSDVVHQLATQFNLTEEEQQELLPSGTAKKFSNRVHWA